MLPSRFVEASCIKCHHSVTELGVNADYGATAPKVYEGFNLVKEYGCFGCHEIHGFDAGKPIGPDIRLEPQTPEEQAKYDSDPALIAGKMRKVGPSLRHLATKASAGWVEYWTEEPKRFRPKTRMPQFFNLTNQHDELAEQLEPAELAGISSYLLNHSQHIDLLSPDGDYLPDAERGKKLFTERGCLACHEHSGIEGPGATFGPDLSRIHEKINRNSDNKAFSDWLYTWVREPTRHHTRTRMPNLYLEKYKQGDEVIDPAADITAFLLSGSVGDYKPLDVPDETLTELASLFLSKAITQAQLEKTLETRQFPIPRDLIKGDEIELTTDSGEAASPEQWRTMMLNYVGRRTISRYGCYGCHDIPGFETARPIGTALQDWGRKDTSKLAPEHIEEYMHHHGEPDGSSTLHRIEEALERAEAGGFEAGEFASQEEEDAEMSASYFFHSLLHHGRPGFIWQKLRQPRSYDHMKIGTKGYDERLRMPSSPSTKDRSKPSRPSYWALSPNRRSRSTSTDQKVLRRTVLKASDC